jgi:glycosyltransferase involved in cell wall biosynthesis
MDAKPFLSILTASLNSSSTIVDCIKSIKNQGFQNFEHIIIDGGSNDNTIEILQKYEKTYNHLWTSQPDNGIADALNKGLQKAQGRYIIVVQADDCLLNQNIFNKVYPYLKNEKIDIVGFPVILNHPTRGKVLRKPIRFIVWNRFKFIFPHQGCFVHKRVFDKVGGFRNEFNICMDYDFFYRALAFNFSVKFGRFPVVLMGGTGVGSLSKFVYKRMEEERLVQMRNERNPGWRIAQFIFRLLYLPYKIYRISLAANNKP